MMPSIVKLPSSRPSSIGGGFARAPVRSRKRATGTMVVILEKRTPTMLCPPASKKTVGSTSKKGLNTQRMSIRRCFPDLVHIHISSYLAHMRTSTFHCPRFCAFVRPQTKMTRGTSLKTLDLATQVDRTIVFDTAMRGTQTSGHNLLRWNVDKMSTLTQIWTMSTLTQMSTMLTLTQMWTMSTSKQMHQPRLCWLSLEQRTHKQSNAGAKHKNQVRF